MRNYHLNMNLLEEFEAGKCAQQQECTPAVELSPTKKKK